MRIIAPIFGSTLKEVLRVPLRIVAGGLLVVGQSLYHGLGTSALTSGMGVFAALVLGPGLVGGPMAQGTLPLILTRPLRRSDYVLTRWVAASLAALLLVTLAYGGALTLRFVRHHELPSWTVLIPWLEDAVGIFRVVAFLLALSVAVTGAGDLVLYVLLVSTAGLGRWLGFMMGHAQLTLWGRRLYDALVPTVDLRAFDRGWASGLAELSTQGIFLLLPVLLAIEGLLRKEVSYGTAGE